jgi:hypothetical protein
LEFDVVSINTPFSALLPVLVTTAASVRGRRPGVEIVDPAFTVDAVDAFFFFFLFYLVLSFSSEEYHQS